MKFINTKLFTVLLLTAGLFSACKKTEVAKDAGDQGQVLVKINNVGVNPANNFPDYAPVKVGVKSTSQSVVLMDLRRDVPNNAELNKSLTVQFTLDTALLNAYNLQTGSSMVLVDNSLFSITGATQVSPGTYQVTFAPGEFAHPVYLTVPDATLFPAGIIQGLPYTFSVESTSGAGRIAFDQRQGIFEIAAVNDYEADYKVTGWFFHPSAGRAINAIKHLYTITQTRVQGVLGDLGSPSSPGGDYWIQFEVDPITNAVFNYKAPGHLQANSTPNSSDFMTLDNPANVDYSDPSNGGHVPGDANFNVTIYNNTYDPATQTFYLHYGYVNGSFGAGQSSYTRQVYEKWVRQ
jgi:hypothetical protein